MYFSKEGPRKIGSIGKQNLVTKIWNAGFLYTNGSWTHSREEASDLSCAHLTRSRSRISHSIWGLKLVMVKGLLWTNDAGLGGFVENEDAGMVLPVLAATSFLGETGLCCFFRVDSNKSSDGRKKGSCSEPPATMISEI